MRNRIYCRNYTVSVFRSQEPPFLPLPPIFSHACPCACVHHCHVTCASLHLPSLVGCYTQPALTPPLPTCPSPVPHHSAVRRCALAALFDLLTSLAGGRGRSEVPCPEFDNNNQGQSDTHCLTGLDNEQAPDGRFAGEWQPS